MLKCPRLNQNQIKELEEVVRDSKSQGPAVRRAQAVLLLNAGVDHQTIVQLTNYSRKHIFTLRARYLRLGSEALQDKRQGKPKELLTKSQRKEIIAILKTKTPKDFDYAYAHWTTGLLGDFIERRYKAKYKSKTSYYLIFRRAHFTYHKPGRVYHKQDPKEVRKWRKKAKKKLKEAWLEQETVVLAEDEMILSNQTTIQKIWLPQGSYPKIEVSNRKENRSIYGFLNVKTGKEHAFKAERQNMYITTRILKRLRKIYPQGKLLIFWDGAGWHRGSRVQEFIQKDQNIETVYFPRYTPEENPQEHVWRQGRSKVTHNRFISKIDQTTNQFIQYLNSNRFSYSLADFSAVS